MIEMMGSAHSKLIKESSAIVPDLYADCQTKLMAMMEKMRKDTKVTIRKETCEELLQRVSRGLK